MKPGIQREAEHVNDIETAAIGIYRAGLGVVVTDGGLIETSCGRGWGFGVPWTNRYGCWLQARRRVP